MTICDLGYLIHGRPYRETSQIATLFTREHGRVSVMHRGAKRGKGQGLQPFCLSQIGWAGRSELKTLKSCDVLEGGFLQGRNLFIGLYLNELLERILRDGQPVTPIFDRYHHLARHLTANTLDMEPLLRSFEYALLDDMGYGFALDVDGATGEAVRAEAYYRFDAQQGLCCCSPVAAKGYKGEHLLAMAAMAYDDPAVRMTAKKLMREALAPHLGSKPLQSRELFRGQMATVEGRI